MARAPARNRTGCTLPESCWEKHVFDLNDNRPGGPLVNPLDDGVRADDRMRAMRGVGSKETSRRSRLVAGWTIALIIIGFFVAAIAGWIDILPR
jgi:hypothetical protein